MCPRGIQKTCIRKFDTRQLYHGVADMRWGVVQVTGQSAHILRYYERASGIFEEQNIQIAIRKSGSGLSVCAQL
jgi:hypothetical protein